MATATKKKIETNIGIEESDREAIAGALSKLLADTYLTYIKSHNYHWNVTGPYFHSLHEMFEEQYTELATAVDEIAERIRILGFRAPATYHEFMDLASVEEDEDAPEAMEMVRRLAESNEAIITTARQALKPAQSADDEASVDLITQRLDAHSKAAWMLRAHLAES